MPATTPMLIFLTYRRLESFGPGGYEAWLAAEDNPFFNSIGGILEYQNWAVVAAAGEPAGFDYFDLLYLDGPEALERVWFDPELTRFRKGWVKRWGYGPAPAAVNRFGWLLAAPAPRPPAAAAALTVTVGGAESGGGEVWRVSERLPKHYALPEGEIPEPWREPAGDTPALGGTAMVLGAAAEMPAAGPMDRFALTARRIAPPAGAAN